MEATECPKKNPADQDIKQINHQCPEMDQSANCPIDRLDIPGTQPVRLTGWVSEVRQIPVKEERRVLWYASDE